MNSFARTLLLWLPVTLAFGGNLRVEDAQHSAIPNARVTVRAGSNLPVVRITDIQGIVPADFPAEVIVEAPGFETGRFTIQGSGQSEATVQLVPAVLKTSVDVVVRDEPGSGPVTGNAVEIQRTGARTVFDAVERLVPAASVTRRGVMGYGIAANGTGGVSIRGVGGQPNTEVLIIVDGRPDFQGLMGHPLPDFYSLSDAASVSVTEGPASVLYGSNAMGGVIEIKPEQPREGSATRLTSSFGSYYTGQHRLAHGTRFDRWFYSMTTGVSHTAGDRPGSAFRAYDGTLALGYDLSSVWKASAEGRYGHFYVEDPGPVQAPLAGSFARVGRGGFSANLDRSAEHDWGYARVFASYGDHYVTDGFRSADSTTGVRLDETFAVRPQLLIEAGSDIVSYGGHARNVLAPIDYGTHSITSAAGFTRAQWTPVPALRLDSGMRYEHNSQFGGIVTPEAGAGVRLREGYSVSVHVTRGFRNPTIRELYLFPAPNPLLKPEHVWSYEASVHARPAPKLAAWATAYYADLSSLIVVTGRFPSLTMQNAGRTLNRGVEAQLRWKPQRRVAVQTGYNWLHSTNLAPYLPAHKWNSSVQVDAGRFLADFGLIRVGARWADAQYAQRMAGYALATLRVSVPVRRNTSFFALVDNLFNQRYEVVPGYPMPGTNAAGGFMLSF